MKVTIEISNRAVNIAKAQLIALAPDEDTQKQVEDAVNRANNNVAEIVLDENDEDAMIMQAYLAIVEIQNFSNE